VTATIGAPFGAPLSTCAVPAFDLDEEDRVDESAFSALARQVVALNRSGKTARTNLKRRLEAE
jgi:hypothetical protein